jgi:hypothetical protein
LLLLHQEIRRNIMQISAPFGREALRTAEFYRRGKAMEAREENMAQRTQLLADKERKANLTQEWTAAFMQNPKLAESPPPEGMPGSVWFGAKMGMVKANTDIEQLKRQGFANDMEKFNRAGSAALAGVASGNREWAKPAILDFFSLIRNGMSDLKEISKAKDGKKARWSYTSNKDGKTYEMDEPSWDFIGKYVNAHSDPRKFMATNVAATEKTAAYNEKQMNDPEDYFAADGRRGMVWRNLKENNGGYHDKYVITDLEGKDTELKTDEEKERFKMEFRNADSEKKKTAINKAQQERNAPKVKTTVKVDGKPMLRADAHKTISMLSRTLFAGKPSALSAVESALAAMKAGVADPFKKKEVGSPYAQAQELVKNKGPGWKNAVRFMELVDAVSGRESGTRNVVDDAMDKYLSKQEAPRTTALPGG